MFISLMHNDGIEIFNSKEIITVNINSENSVKVSFVNHKIGGMLDGANGVKTFSCSLTQAEEFKLKLMNSGHI